MANFKIKNSWYDQETGNSMTTILTPLGEFTGTAQLHPDDKKIESHYAGCNYAETRAILKYIKAKKKIIKERLIGLKQFQKQIEQQKMYNPKEYTARKLKKQIILVEMEYKKWENRYNSLSDKLAFAINSRDKIINRIHKIKIKED